MSMDTLENTMILVYPDQEKLHKKQKDYLKNVIDPLIKRINLKDIIFIRYSGSSIEKEIVKLIIPILERDILDHLIMNTYFKEEIMNEKIDYYLLQPLDIKAQQVIIVSHKEFNKSAHKKFVKRINEYDDICLYH